MTALVTLTKRHILLYIRDRSAIFFSMLSVLIVLLMMLVFLKDMNRDELIQLIQNANGTINQQDASHL
ncbi:ABC transporter permease, partial [Erysipelatoclostridium ramosum]|nr:ABC transporter permease [Thomasclavelia ramosa]